MEKEQNKSLELISKNHNKGTIILITSILTGYAFFFLSPFLFHERPIKQYTNLNETVNFGSGKATVESWIYSPEQNKFEICCSFSNVSINDIKIESSCNFDYKSKGVKPLECDTMFSNSDYLVAEVYGIPEDWYCASLKLISKADKETEPVPTEDNTVNQENEILLLDDDEESSTEIKCSVFACIENIEKVEQIQDKKNKDDYIVERAERKIIYDNKLIDDNKAKITAYDDDISGYYKEIGQIQDEMSFQVESEIKISQDRIKSLQNKIKETRISKQSLIDKNDKLEAEVNQYQYIIDDIKKKTSDKN